MRSFQAFQVSRLHHTSRLQSSSLSTQQTQPSRVATSRCIRATPLVKVLRSVQIQNAAGRLGFNSSQAMTWILTAAAILLTFGRYLLRYRTLARFCWDDAAHALALITLIAVVSTYTVLFPQVYLIDDVARGKATKPSASDYLIFLKLQIAVSVCWWVSVYAVKCSFMLLYRMLFVVSTRLNVIWWSIAAFTIVTFWVCIAGELTTCGPSKHLMKEGRLLQAYYADLDTD